MKTKTPYRLISIIIINKNELGVEGTLELLTKQEAPLPFEIIVVDASNGALNKIYARFPNVICIPFVSKSTKKITIPEQRNVGIKAAHGDIVVFIDACCDPTKKWLASLTAQIIEGNEKLVAGGTLSTGERTFHDVVYESQKRKKYIDQAPTINLAIDSSVFSKVGYFDENLLYGSDMDFTWRAKNAGYKIRNAPEALITHDWGSLRQELKRAYRYGQAKIKLYRKHNISLATFVHREFALVFYVGFVVGLPITLLSPIYPLFVLLPIVKNFRDSPFKLALINFTTAYGAVRELLAI